MRQRCHLTYATAPNSTPRTRIKATFILFLLSLIRLQSYNTFPNLTMLATPGHALIPGLTRDLYITSASSRDGVRPGLTPSTRNYNNMAEEISSGMPSAGRLRTLSYSWRISSQTSGWMIPENTSDSILDVEESGLWGFAAATNTFVSITAYIILLLSYLSPIWGYQFINFFIGPLVLFFSSQLLSKIKSVLRCNGPFLRFAIV